MKPAGGSQRGRNCPRTMNEINNSSENLGMWSINANIFIYTLWGYPHMTSIINYLEFWCLNFLSEIILKEKYSCLMCWSKEKLTLEVISGSCLSHAESYSPHNHMQWFRRERIILFNLSNIHFSFTLHSQMWPIMGSRWMRVSQKILLPRRPSLKRIPMVSITSVRVLTT